MQPMHDCSAASTHDAGILSACTDAAGLTTGGIVTIVVVVLLLAGLGFGVWKWIQARQA